MANGVALVTGASSGIGAEFARQLGADGFDLVLVARRADRLETLGCEIEKRSGIRCHVVPCDLSRPGAASQVFAATTALGLDIDWLVNNAGFATRGAFASLPVEAEIEEIQLHVAAAVSLARLYLPGMIARRRGQIINLGSIGSFIPTPYMATYSGVKAFILSFSEALGGELSSTGVGVMALCPGATRTEFQQVAGVSGTLPAFAFTGPGPVVRQAIAGARRGKHVVAPGLINKATMAFARITPHSLLVRMSGFFFKPQKAG